MKLRRRKYINDPGYQLKIAISFLAITLAANIVSIAVFNYIALKKLEDIIWSTHISVKNTGDIINSLFMYVNIIDVFFITVALIIMGYWMLRKTTGPLIRMSRDIRHMTEGDLISRIKLDKKDEFQDVAAEIDSMRENLREKVGFITNAHNDVSRSINELSASGSSRESILEKSGNVISSINKLEAEANRLKF